MKKIVTSLLVVLLPLFSLAQKSDTTTKPPSWFYNITSVNVCLGISEFGSPYNIGVRNISDYRFNSIVTAGLGIEFIRYNYSKLNFLPLLVDARVFLPLKKVKPFIAMDGGYGVALTQNCTGAIILNPAIGISIPITRITAINIAVGYRVQKYSLSETANGLNFESEFNGTGFNNTGSSQSIIPYTYKGSFQSIDIDLGISF